MNALRKLLLEMSDDDLTTLFSVIGITPEQAAAIQRIEGPQGRWFDQAPPKLPKYIMTRLNDAMRRREDLIGHVDRKWVRYAEAFREMKLFRSVPTLYSDPVDCKRLARRLEDFCLDNDLPEEMAVQLLPCLIEFILTGRMRPCIVIGSKGSGKTTALRILLENALEIPVEILRIPDMCVGFGLTGTAGHYQSANMGALAMSQYRHGQRVVGLLIDEIDKVALTYGEEDVSNVLLSVTDGSVDTIEDKYLEFPLQLSHMPIFFSANDQSMINPTLMDRCTVILWPDPTQARLSAILKKYAEKQLSSAMYSMIDFDYELLNKSIASLISKGVVSIRKHEQLVEQVLRQAFEDAMHGSADRVPVTGDMFLRAEKQICEVDCRRKAGFSS